MRCPNCGWPNKPGEVNCSKCGSPLSANPGMGAPAEAPVNSYNQASGAAGVAATVYEPGKPSQPTVQSVCPVCGFPLRPGTTRCPQCQNDIANPSSNNNNVQQQPAPEPRSFHRQPTVQGDNGKKFSGTVNPYLNFSGNYFTLEPLKKQGERHELENVEFNGDSVELNRDNLDPRNQSITSQTQAVISRFADKWFIEDKSSLKSTFVQANKPLEIHEGDIILMGDRLFVFHE